MNLDLVERVMADLKGHWQFLPRQRLEYHVSTLYNILEDVVQTGVTIRCDVDGDLATDTSGCANN